jgi:virginiamycin B lyase
MTIIHTNMRGPSMLNRRKILGALSVLAVLNTAAQAGEKTGVIVGTVSLSTASPGGPVYGLMVKAAREGGNTTTSVFTDAKGSYEFPPLPLGNYHVTVGSAASAEVPLTSTGASKDFSVTLGPDFIGQTTGASWMALTSLTPEERTKVMSTCGNCHSLWRLFNTPMNSVAEWSALGSTMVKVAQPTAAAGGSAGSGPATITDEEYSVGMKADKFNALIELVAKAATKDLALNHVADAIVRPSPDLNRAVFTEWDLSGLVVQSGTWTPYVAPDGMIWFCYEGVDGISGVGRLDPTTGQAKIWPSGINDGVFHDMFGDDKGNLWITASKANKIVKFDTKSLKYTIWSAPATTSHWPHTCRFDREGHLWCTLEMGNGAVMELDPRNGEMKEYPISAKNGDPYGLLVDRKDNVWFTAKQASLLINVDKQTGQMTEYPFPTPHAGPRRLKEDSKGRLWISEYYADKIGMFDPAAKNFTEYSTGLIGGPYFLRVDRSDIVWFNMLSGGVIGQFDPKNERFSYVPFPHAGTHVRDPDFDYTKGGEALVYAIVYEGSGTSPHSGAAPTIGRMYVRR